MKFNLFHHARTLKRFIIDEKNSLFYKLSNGKTVSIGKSDYLLLVIKYDFNILLHIKLVIPALLQTSNLKKNTVFSDESLNTSLISLIIIFKVLKFDYIY